MYKYVYKTNINDCTTDRYNISIYDYEVINRRIWINRILSQINHLILVRTKIAGRLMDEAVVKKFIVS